LERLGNRVITMDLPVSDPDAGVADYARVVEEAIGPGGEPVLVGHSMGGLVIPLVAAHRSVRRLVFLAAFLPSPGRSANDQRADEPVDPPVPPATAQWADLGDDVWMVGPETATEIFFHDLPAELAAWATRRLRPQCYRPLTEITPLDAWPEVERRAIVCADDRAINPDWVRTAARERLGTEAVELPGGHSPHLARPRDLAQILHQLAG
jgi:pimeloyl-ACP methyl ester carboxylesterase